MKPFLKNLVFLGISLVSLMGCQRELKAVNPKLEVLLPAALHRDPDFWDRLRAKGGTIDVALRLQERLLWRRQYQVDRNADLEIPLSVFQKNESPSFFLEVEIWDEPSDKIKAPLLYGSCEIGSEEIFKSEPATLTMLLVLNRPILRDRGGEVLSSQEIARASNQLFFYDRRLIRFPEPELLETPEGAYSGDTLEVFFPAVKSKKIHLK